MTPTALPAETAVYLSRWKVPLLILWFGGLSVGITMLLLRTAPPPLAFSAATRWIGYVFGWLLAAAFAFYAGQYGVQLLRNKPVFRIGVLGIQLGTDPRDPWSGIRDEQVVVTDGKRRRVELCYLTPSAIRRLEINDCGITAHRLRELLAYYRQHALASSASRQ